MLEVSVKQIPLSHKWLHAVITLIQSHQSIRGLASSILVCIWGHSLILSMNKFSWKKDLEAKNSAALFSMFLSIFLNPAKTATEPKVGRLQKLCWFCSLVWTGLKKIIWAGWVSDGQEKQIYFNKTSHKEVELVKILKFQIELHGSCWCISTLHYSKKKKKEYMTITKVYRQSKQSLLLSDIRVLSVLFSLTIRNPGVHSRYFSCSWFCVCTGLAQCWQQGSRDPLWVEARAAPCHTQPVPTVWKSKTAAQKRGVMGKEVWETAVQTPMSEKEARRKLLFLSLCLIFLLYFA